MLRKLKNIVKSWPLPKLAACGTNAVISRPRFLLNPNRISIGNNVYIGKDSVISALAAKDGSRGQISIGSGVWATSRLSLFSLGSVTIEDDVLIASNVFISDCSYGHTSGDIPFSKQGYDSVSPIKIGAGSWLGQNCVIMPGVVIGHNSIVGANSVVTRSIPPGSIAVGAPAKVIKSWNAANKSWDAVRATSSES